MTTDNPHTSHSQIVRLLNDDRFFDAIHMLEGQTLTADMTDRLHEARTIYNQLLHYFKTGTPDPSRPAQVEDVREMLYSVADSLRRAEELDKSSALYYSRLRISQMSSYPSLSEQLAQVRNLLAQLSLADVTGEYDEEIHARFDSALSALFYTLWVNQSLSRQQLKDLQTFILDDFEADEEYVLATASMISALTLSSLEYFDRRKFYLLLQIIERDANPVIVSRALIGATIIAVRHPRRAASGVKVKAISEAIAERDGFQAMLRALVAAMLRTRDTDRVNRKMRDEIIPDIIKLKPEIEKRLSSANPEELTSMEESPEWMEMIEKSGINDKLREFSEMQMQGADVFMGAFSGMKNFAFFRDMPNWFLPFSLRSSHVHNALKDAPAPLAKIMLDIPLFCSSDKFSLAFSLSRMPKSQAEMMSAQMQGQFAALSEEQKTSLAESLKSSLESEMVIYLKDLFRFHRLWEGRQEFFDPFASGFVIPRHPLFAGIETDRDLMRMMADFYFSNHYWREAAPIYEQLAAGAVSDSSDAEKQGYCLEKTGNPVDALQAYQRAELLAEPSKWLLKRIAYCLRATGQYHEAAGYYSRALEKEPDNLRLELLKGHSLLEAGEPAEALKSYYKVVYHDSDSSSATRAIAWCEFLLGNFSKSRERYAAITLRDDVTPSDFLNFGHVLMAEGKYGEAAEQYRQMAALTSKDDLRTSIERDRTTLLKAGITPLTITLTADLATK